MTDYEINSKVYEVEYDLDNRVITVDVNNSDVEYRYDALGRRVIRKEGSDKTALIWWGNSENAKYEHSAGQATIQNDVMSHPSRLNSVIARAVDGSKFDLEWYHKTYLDHVYAVSDDSGDLNEHYRYTAFGEVTIYNNSGTVQSSTQINNTITWNTRRLDSVSNYYLYKYRHYDPQLGRWPSRDPIEELGGVNLYAFVENDPVNRWDRLGLITWICVCSQDWDYKYLVTVTISNFRKDFEYPVTVRGEGVLYSLGFGSDKEKEIALEEAKTGTTEFGVFMALQEIIKKEKADKARENIILLNDYDENKDGRLRYSYDKEIEGGHDTLMPKGLPICGCFCIE